MRILIIEDDKDVLNFLKPSLEEKGFVADAISDGNKGTFMALTNDYDLIILDLNLPGKNGDLICQQLRSEGKITPVIILTVKTDIESKVKLLNCGADDYLAKPFSFEELLARIKALLRRSPAIASNVLKIGDLALDKTKQKVTRAGREVYLTLKEFSLLEYLMSNAEKVISRAEILEHVWDMEGDAFSNAIETHIFNLRHKINKGCQGKELIQTVPCRGYKIG
jgi:DNA-binding response OmpR family regulator